MKLNKEHRESLLSRLEKVNLKLSIKKECLSKSDNKEGVYFWHQIDDFLLEEEKELINKSLIDNEIDY